MFNFNNDFTEQLPADSVLDNYPRQVDNACYSFVEPTQTHKPTVISVSHDFAEALNLSNVDLKSDWFQNIVSGNQVLEPMKPYAMCYGGHQFGHWAGQLGDGRAINLGEVIDNQGNQQTLQLKGAGLTPYSRTADGLAVLRSSVREFICSEAMFYLGIPTTRALSLSLTGDKVMRDMFYDGNAEYELGAVVCRVSPSFLRFGSFQIHASKHQQETLVQLMDYSIRTNFSHLGRPSNEVYEKWFDEICQSTMNMIIGWMRVGFVHGVMNTDNMSILGQTIDYGPYGWLEGYDQSWTPNTTDAQGKRYSYGNQPQVAHWNLFQLAQAIAPVIKRVESLEKSLASFTENYTELSQQMYADKLGLEKHNGKQDDTLIGDLLNVLKLTETDMTIFFRQLSQLKTEDNHSGNNNNGKELLKIIIPAFYSPNELKNEVLEGFVTWLNQYIKRVENQKWNNEQRSQKMNQNNPKYILRNYLVQVAIDKANNGDYSEIEKLLTIMSNPYNDQPEFEEYASKRPDWAKHKAGCSMLSCSS